MLQHTYTQGWRISAECGWWRCNGNNLGRTIWSSEKPGRYFFSLGSGIICYPATSVICYPVWGVICYSALSTIEIIPFARDPDKHLTPAGFILRSEVGFCDSYSVILISIEWKIWIFHVIKYHYGILDKQCCFLYHWVREMTVKTSEALNTN
jgi:hypothetical protein